MPCACSDCKPTCCACAHDGNTPWSCGIALKILRCCDAANAVPLTVFLLDYCIRYPTNSLTDVAANELEVISSIDRDFESPASPAATKEKVKVQMNSQLGQLG